MQSFKAGKKHPLFIAEEVIVQAQLPDGVVLAPSRLIEQELYVLGLACEMPYSTSIFSAVWLIWRRSLTDRENITADICTVGGVGSFTGISPGQEGSVTEPSPGNFVGI